METTIHCPTCRAENAVDASVCVVCGSRVFAWLGDSFGARDTTADRTTPDTRRSIYWDQSHGTTAVSTAGGLVAAPGPTANVRVSFPVSKWIVAALLTVALLFFSEVGGM